ncbi:MAG: hypothetical protein ACN4GZ_15155, partial [Acidimicrobiales bacterium]
MVSSLAAQLTAPITGAGGGISSDFVVAEVLSNATLALPSPAVGYAPEEMVLDSIHGKPYAVRDWLTSYPLLLVSLDPYTHESAWILETAGRFLDHFTPANVRTAWLCTSDAEGCRQFLGPWADKFLTFADEDRTVVDALGIERLPSVTAIYSDLSYATASGWDPTAWREITAHLAKVLSWS